MVLYGGGGAFSGMAKVDAMSGEEHPIGSDVVGRSEAKYKSQNMIEPSPKRLILKFNTELSGWDVAWPNLLDCA